MTSDPPTSEVPPTRVRYRVLAFLCSLSLVVYLDRICISQAVGPIQQELGIDNRWMGYVLRAFTLAYGLFEIPTGHWGDRYGSRGVLTRIVLWWSVFTALTGAATGLAMLLVVRFLLIGNGLVMLAIGALYILYGGRPSGYVVGGALAALALILFACVPLTDPYRHERRR